jgi:hypothetical protein
MKNSHLSCAGLILATLISFISQPACAKSQFLLPTQLADVCQEAPPPGADAASIFTSTSLDIKEGYTINVLRLKKKRTLNIAVLLHNAGAPGGTEVPKIVAVCLDGSQQITLNNNGDIVFTGHWLRRSRMLFRLVNFSHIFWEATPRQSLGIVETTTKDSYPQQGQIPACLNPSDITEANSRHDLKFTMCSNYTFKDRTYKYSLFLDNGTSKPVVLDPQIIHHPN